MESGASGEMNSGASGDGHPLARLDGLCALAVRTLPVSGAAVVLSTPAGRQLVTSADPISVQLEDLVAVCGEGPALDAATQGRPELAADLRDANSSGRWPIFSNEAAGIGVEAVFALPLRIGVIGLGVFVAHRDEPGALTSQEFSALLRIADAVGFAVLDLTLPESVRHEQRADDERGAAAVAAEVISAEIHQASGMVMVQLGVPIATALARLRARAYADGRPLIDTAKAVIARQLTFTSDNDVSDSR